MIYGIGTDICDIRRISAVFERHGERFVQEILTESEMLMWVRRNPHGPEHRLRYLATRFSAKESFSKAVGLGMRMPMHWHYCEVVNGAGDRPAIALHGPMRDWFETHRLVAHLNMTDKENHAMSFCVIEQIDA
jgi:holo-[acyl-carrier-protein] synthase